MDLINSENNDKCIYELRGKVYLELEIYNKALKDFEVVASIEPDYPDIYYYLGICKSNLKEIDEAIADFFKAL
jgi:tetratricopeptide (TPR) repeat protein